MNALLENWTPNATVINFVDEKTWPKLCQKLTPISVNYAQKLGFDAKPGSLFFAPAVENEPACVFFGVDQQDTKKSDPFQAGKLVALLPAGLYRFGDSVKDKSQATLAFLLSAYSFSDYVTTKKRKPSLCAPKEIDHLRIKRIAEAIYLGRNLVNTPANDMGPEALEQAALALAKKYGAETKNFVAEDLLHKNFPLIHAVGRAAAQPPRLVEFWHGPMDGLKITLVGKGVCFDSGGLDIKPASAMQLMKKDMGGAATTLSLAMMIMDSNISVRLRVLIPIVENSISANAFRPGDIYPSRKGLSVEIGDTDAEGRLILADALAYAGEEPYDLLFNFATLTGAARVALGPELPPFYTDNDELAQEIFSHAMKSYDPLWRMPLWNNYDKALEGKISDLVSVTSGGFSGSITAALFLRRFVNDPSKWAHFDIYAWNPITKPGKPEGGEVQAARALYDLIERRVEERKLSR